MCIASLCCFLPVMYQWWYVVKHLHSSLWSALKVDIETLLIFSQLYFRSFGWHFYFWEFYRIVISLLSFVMLSTLAHRRQCLNGILVFDMFNLCLMIWMSFKASSGTVRCSLYVEIHACIILSHTYHYICTISISLVKILIYVAFMHTMILCLHNN